MMKIVIISLSDILAARLRRTLPSELRRGIFSISSSYFLLNSSVARTAISLAINNGLPVAYVSSLSGTLAENIQKYYYNRYNKLNVEKLKKILDE